MNTIMPIIVPMNQPACPACGRKEKKVEVCQHCGHEYMGEPIGFWDVLVGLSVIGFIVWAVVTIIWWLIEQDTFMGQKAPSLWEVIKSQWEFIKGLRII